MDIAGYAPRGDAPSVAFHYSGAAVVARNNGHIAYRDYEPVNSIREDGAGDGDRTHVASLEGWGFTTKLRPRAP